MGAGLGGDGQDYPYAEMLRIYDDGSPWLAYATQIVSVRDGHWIHSESGWWRDHAGDDGRDGEGSKLQVELALTSASGLTEILVGELEAGKAGEQIELATDVVARTATAPAVTAERRLYAVRGGKLMYAIDRATADSRLSPHLAAALDRVNQ